ncbi:MAG: aldolase/citrate lyase family protein [Alphaproteobacteria bacterium]|jgi:2-keto-3-deoxy-L-rhamnonate aldolase RhmA|nr:aldolase/citrate lyase family protein [Alphaproteobacteria bacterium]
MVAIAKNTALEKLKDGRLALGMLVRLSATVEIAKVAQATDHDFLFIDMQHAGMSIESAIKVCLAALDSGVTPLVRVSSKRALEASRLLDNGALGIVAPDVETAEEARHLVATCRFPPRGERSVYANYPQFGYRSVPIAEATRALDENTLVVAMIESGTGVENADAIAAVDGIDVLHIGSNDLLTEMGLPGEMGSKRHYELAGKVAAACRAHGKFFGVGGARSPEQQARFIAMGARFMTTNSDLAFLMAAAAERTKQLREMPLD